MSDKKNDNGKKDLHAQTRLPLYGKPTVHLVVTDDIKRAHEDRSVEWTSDCSPSGGESHAHWPHIHLFVEWRCLNDRWMDHECFHVAVSACDMLGIDVQQNDDSAAYLFEWLRMWLRRVIEKNDARTDAKPAR